jgi:hypothetical protein
MIWAYMVGKGIETKGQWNYYGGNWEEYYQVEYHDREPRRQAMLDRIKKGHVDWEATEIPVSDTESEFMGTDCDSNRVETLLGTLVLKNGDKIKIGVSGADTRFATYAKTLADLLEDQSRIDDIFGE